MATCENGHATISGVELDPCKYETLGYFENVTVEVMRCKLCGKVELSWYRQNNTVELDETGRAL